MLVQELPILKPGYGSDTPSPQVKYLQTLLGFPKDQIDGRFGTMTEIAVRSLQRSRSLTVDGIVGKQTWDALTLGDNPIFPVPLVGQFGYIHDRWKVALINISSKGSSATTAGQDGLSSGLSASQQMARDDLPRVLEIKDIFCQVSNKLYIPAAILAAISSRESRCGRTLQHRWGNDGHSFGIMQIDHRFNSPLAGLGNPASLEHIEQAAGILVTNLNQLLKKYPDWEDEFILQGAIAAYNAGIGSVQIKTAIDEGTTGDDYSSDVVARAQFYLQYLD